MSPARLANIKNASIPTLVMTGTNDKVLLQPVSSFYLAKALGARLEIFEGAGHSIRLQFPDRHNDELHRHILNAEKLAEQRMKDGERIQEAFGIKFIFPSESNTTLMPMKYQGHFVEEKHFFTKHITVEVQVMEKLDVVTGNHSHVLLGPVSLPVLSRESSRIAISSFNSIESISKLEGSSGAECKRQKRATQDDAQNSQRRFVGFLPSLGIMRFGFRDIVSMIPGSSS
jgi:hypothetical protein